MTPDRRHRWLGAAAFCGLIAIATMAAPALAGFSVGYTSLSLRDAATGDTLILAQRIRSTGRIGLPASLVLMSPRASRLVKLQLVEALALSQATDSDVALRQLDDLLATARRIRGLPLPATPEDHLLLGYFMSLYEESPGKGIRLIQTALEDMPHSLAGRAMLARMEAYQQDDPCKQPGIMQRPYDDPALDDDLGAPGRECFKNSMSVLKWIRSDKKCP